MAKHLDIARDIGAKVYFCDAASPWQRSSNENTNGLLRQYSRSPPTSRSIPHATSS
jgi:IS30 family transposase